MMPSGSLSSTEGKKKVSQEVMHHIITCKDKPVWGALQLTDVTATIQFVKVSVFGIIDMIELFENEGIICKMTFFFSTFQMNRLDLSAGRLCDPVRFLVLQCVLLL